MVRGIPVAICLLIGFGCSDQSKIDPNSPFDKYGGEKTAKATSLKSFELLEPTDGSTFSPGVPIRCILSVEPAVGESLPTLLHVTLWDVGDRGKLHTEYPIASENPGDASYQYVAVLTAPERPGTYRIYADGTDYVKPDGRADVLPTDVVVAEDEIHIKVVKP